MKRDTEFRKWYDAREGTKSESFAYDVWCAAWGKALKPEACVCVDKERCDLNDRCLKGESK